jgi:ferredoxin
MCTEIAGHLFRRDPGGRAVVVRQPTADDQDLVAEAEESCPVSAIRLGSGRPGQTRH